MYLLSLNESVFGNSCKRKEGEARKVIVTHVLFSTDREQLVSGGDDGTVVFRRLRDVVDGFRSG